MLDKEDFYKIMDGEGKSDYEIYLNTKKLFSCQKNFDSLCNQDELMFQITHQVEELWMKTINHTLLNINDHFQLHNNNLILTLFKRVHLIQKMMIEQLSVLETMSPKDYQLIRLGLGSGSGIESPGFRATLKIAQLLWHSFQKYYLNNDLTKIEKIYNSEYQHCDCYIIAESLIEFDELFQNFRYKHIKIVERTIGIDSLSLKGRSVKLLNHGIKQQFFPQLWEIRSVMTNKCHTSYGQ